MARPDMTPDLGNEFWIRTQLLAGCSGTLVKVFDPLSAGTASGIAQVPFEEGARANAVQWTHNNKALVFAGQRGTVALYSSGRYLGGIPNETSVSLMREITALRLSSDSLKLVAGCSDGAMHVWDTRVQERVHLIDDHKSAIASIAVCPSEAGDIVASSSTSGEVRLHSLASGSCYATLPMSDRGAKRGLSFSPLDAALLGGGSEDGSMYVWNVRERIVMQHLKGKHTGHVSGVAFSPVNTHLMHSCGGDGRLAVWDRRTQNEQVAVRHAAGLSCLASRDDGLYVAVGSVDGNVSVYDTRRLSAAAEPLARLGFGASREPVTELAWQRHATLKKSGSAGRAAAPGGGAPPRPPVEAAQPSTSPSRALPQQTPAPIPKVSAPPAGYTAPAFVTPGPAFLGAGAKTGGAAGSQLPGLPAAPPAQAAGAKPVSIEQRLQQLKAAAQGAPTAEAVRLNAAAAAAAAATGAGAAAAASDGFAFRAPAPAVGVSQPAPLAGSSSSSAAGSAQPYLYAPSSGALSNGGDQPSRSASDASGAAFRPPWQSPGKARPDGFGAPSAASTGSRPRPESPLPGKPGSAARNTPTRSRGGGADIYPSRPQPASPPHGFPPGAEAAAAAVAAAGEAAAGLSVDTRGLAAMLQAQEAATKALLADVSEHVSEAVRNLHIDMVRQVFCMQTEMTAAFQQVAANQEALASRLDGLQQQLDQLMHSGLGWM